jgi:DNA invertase Pin-like site-specific DNA recombinase
MSKAFAYLRTSSATNVGKDKDSDKRQRAAIETYAKAHGVEIVGEYYDAAVSGADPIFERQGFVAMLAAIAGNGVKTILIETANRFARKLTVQELGFEYLKKEGIELIAVDNPDGFLSDDPMVVAFRQIMGVFAELEKTMTVAKLKAARDRKRALMGRCDGRLPAPEEARVMAKKLRKEGLALRGIGVQLAAAGFLSPSGKPYLAQSVKAMLK